MANHRKKRTVVKENKSGKFASPKTANKDETYELSIDSDAKELAKLKEAVLKIMPLLENHINNEAHSAEDRKNVEALQRLLK